MGTFKSNEARGPVNGQQPQPVQTGHSLDKGVKRDTPPRGDKWSLTRRVGEALKWRDRSHTIGRHAQWTTQYNGLRYLLQYVHWQTVHPQLAPISEWEEEIVNEKLQKLQMTTASSSHSFTSLGCQDCPVIRRTSTPSFQCVPPRHDAAAGSNWDASLDNLQSFLPSDGRSANDGKESNLSRQFHSNANLYDRIQQRTLTPVTVPATADNGASVTSARDHARRTFPVMSTCSLAQQ